MKNAMVTCEYGCCSGRRICLGDEKEFTIRHEVKREERKGMKDFRREQRRAKESAFDL